MTPGLSSERNDPVSFYGLILGFSPIPRPASKSTDPAVGEFVHLTYEGLKKVRPRGPSYINPRIIFSNLAFAPMCRGRFCPLSMTSKTRVRNHLWQYYDPMIIP